MPEASFPSGYQIQAIEIDADSPLTDSLLQRFVSRDVWLNDQMAKFGGPASVGAGSITPFEGNVTVAANTAMSGLHYYDNLTINSGVVVTVSEPLIIVARGTVTVSGTITANGAGAVVTTPGGVITPGNGQTATGGGSGSTFGSQSSAGGEIQVPYQTIAGGGLNAAGQTASGRSKLLMLSDYAGQAIGGASGGGRMGGAGGGIIIIAAPTINLSGGALTAAGNNGGVLASNPGGGGGGGGLIHLKTKNYTAGSVSVAGGAGGNNAGGIGGTGGPGIIQIDIYN